MMVLCFLSWFVCFFFAIPPLCRLTLNITAHCCVLSVLSLCLYLPKSLLNFHRQSRRSPAAASFSPWWAQVCSDDDLLVADSRKYRNMSVVCLGKHKTDRDTRAYHRMVRCSRFSVWAGGIQEANGGWWDGSPPAVGVIRELSTVGIWFYWTVMLYEDLYFWFRMKQRLSSTVVYLLLRNIGSYAK